MPSVGFYLTHDFHHATIVRVAISPMRYFQRSEAETLFRLFLIKFLVHDIPLAVTLNDLA
jgi:hypothetical protein